MSLLSTARNLVSKTIDHQLPKDQPWHEKPLVKNWVPGASSIKPFKEKKYTTAAKHLAKDAAYWSTIGFPDSGFVSGLAAKHLATRLLKIDTEGGKRVKKIKEAVGEYRSLNLAARI